MTADVTTLKTTIGKFATETGKEMKTKVTNTASLAGENIKALMGKVKQLAVAYAGFRAIKSYIPEIGRAFSHAGDIMLRNLFWPLRKLLIPLLQKMLNWTRDHRAMFARWGTMIANIFRTVIQIVKGLVELIKSFVDGFMNKFEAMFGKTVNKMSDLMNIIMFKIAVVLTFLMELLKPVFSAIGNYIANVVGLWSDFIEGFKVGLGDIMPEIADFYKSIADLWNLFGDLTERGGVLTGVFKTLGVIVGGTLGTALKAIVQLIDWAVFGITNLIKSYQLWQAIKSKDKEAFTRLKKEQLDEQDAMKKRMDDRWGRWVDDMKDAGGAIKDAWVAPEKTINKTSSGVKDALDKVGTQPRQLKTGTQEATRTINSNVKVGDINVNIKSEMDARKAGDIVAKGIKDGVQKQFRFGVADADTGVASTR